jgi:hypothetical protein
MYCPGCGSEERQISQFCRACGTDLRVVRSSLERPDVITESAVTAREQIGRAVAEKILEFDDSRDLKRVAEDVLPQIEKFLESPEEKRLRRMRSGVITAACGIGATVMALLGLAVVQSLKDPDALPMLIFLMGLGIVTFMIGLGLVINGRLLTQPGKSLKDSSSDAQAQNLLDAGYAPPQLRPAAVQSDLYRSATTSDLAEAERRAGASVTEHTTHHLKTER